MTEQNTYAELSDDVHAAVFQAGYSISEYGGTIPDSSWMDTDPPALVLHFHADQDDWVRREVARRTLAILRSGGLVVEHPDVTDTDGLVDRVMSGGWVAVRRAD